MSEYNLKSVQMPYLSGAALKIFARLLESPLKTLFLPKLLQDAGITWLSRQNIDDAPTYYPFHFVDIPADELERFSPENLPVSRPERQRGFQFATVYDYAQAYRSGEITPTDVAHRILDAITASDTAQPPLRAIIASNRDDLLAQAAQSTERIKNGESLSLFDGVPVAVKDEMDMVPFPTTVGTAFLGDKPATEDATVVARMRSAGALLIGKTNMHEIGIGVTGQNPHHGTPRNPYNPNHYTGGSSSGAATAVAAGLCPVAIGADGGGSIRIPAALCGAVGLKPTFGRISEFGAAPLDWSVAHLGPIGATVADVALAYAVMAGPDLKDDHSLIQPSPSLDDWDNTDLSDLTLGVYWEWFRHATGDVVAANEAMLRKLKARGATVREITIPHLEEARVAQVIIIASEMAQALNRYHARHHKEYGLDVRLNLALARAFTSRDYIQAQRVRTQNIAAFKHALISVDAIITPATGVAAPHIPPTALPDGDSDLTTLTEIMRFAPPANLSGLPAIAFPAGYTPSALPIGMQAIGRPWQENTLFRIALAAEQSLERVAPQIHFPIL